MNADMMTLFWRITEGEHAGLEAVSLLMPASGVNNKAAEFPTEVSFHADSSIRPRDERWSDEDSDLFLSLLDRVVDVSEEPEVTLDISDELVQGIVQLVALVRFKSPEPIDELAGRDLNVPRQETEIGDLVAVNTRYGFVMAIVVGMDSIDITCVLLEPMNDEKGTMLMPDHSVLLVNRVSVVPASFCDTETSRGATVH